MKPANNKTSYITYRMPSLSLRHMEFVGSLEEKGLIDEATALELVNDGMENEVMPDKIRDRLLPLGGVKYRSIRDNIKEGITSFHLCLKGGKLYTYFIEKK